MACVHGQAYRCRHCDNFEPAEPCREFPECGGEDEVCEAAGGDALNIDFDIEKLLPYLPGEIRRTRRIVDGPEYSYRLSTEQMNYYVGRVDDLRRQARRRLAKNLADLMLEKIGQGRILSRYEVVEMRDHGWEVHRIRTWLEVE